MKKLIFIFSSLFLCSLFTFGQLQINWQQSYGGSEYENAASTIQTEDGGYFVLGASASIDGHISNNIGNGDYWIVKVDDMGNILWDKSFGGSSGEYLYDGFYAANSNDIYLVGHSGSTDGDISFDPYSGETNIWAVRINNNGDIIWDRKVGSPIGLIYEKWGSPTNDGGVICAAQADYQGGDITTYYGFYDAWIIKLNSLGETEWDFTMGTSSLEAINEIVQTSDGGYVAAIYGSPTGTDGNIDCECINYSVDAIVYKIDANGNGEWNRCYGGSQDDGISTILETEDGYLVAGVSESNDGDLEGSGWHGDYDIWLFKIDLSGNIIWSKCYGGTNYDSPREIFETVDGDFIIFSITHSFNCDVIGNPSMDEFNPSIWVFKIDTDGNLLWQQCIGGRATERVHGVTQLPNNNYAVAAETNFSPSGDVNCSNFIQGWGSDYWAFGLTDVTVGVNELSNPREVAIYPNPASSTLTIQLPEFYDIEHTVLELIDINGSLVLKLNPESLVSHLDIRHLKRGLYMMKILHESTLLTKKIVIE